MTLTTYAGQLAVAEAPALRARLDAVYRELWPDGSVTRIAYLTDPQFQASGRDVQITLRGARGKPVTHSIEEKIRAPGRCFPDLCVELQSNVERQTLGWVYTSTADFLAYVRQPAGQIDVLLLPLPAFRQWFTLTGHHYTGRVDSQTRLAGGAYTTRNCLIPLRDPALRLFLRTAGYRYVRRPLAGEATP